MFTKQISSEKDVLLLQEDLDYVIEWSKSNNMLLNEDKFELIILRNKPKSAMYELPFMSEFMSYNFSISKWRNHHSSNSKT